MTDTVRIPNGHAPEAPGDRLEMGRIDRIDGVLAKLFGSRREFLWWLLIVAMALVDAVGFWIVLGEVIANENRNLLLLLVLGGALTSVAVPHQMGAMLRARSDGFPGSITLVIFFGLVWFALGVIMVYVRLQADAGGGAADAAADFGGVLADQPATSTVSGPLITAFILACLYLATGAVAGRHAWEICGSSEDSEDRRLTAVLRWSVRERRQDQYEDDVEAQRIGRMEGGGDV